MPRDTRQLIRRVGAALPAVALIGGGAALASTGSGEPPLVCRSPRPGRRSPSRRRRARRPTPRCSPRLPPVPSEMAALPAAFSPAGSSQDPASGVPAAPEAYRHAAALVDAADPACNVDWALVAAIGKVESNHGTYAGNGIDDLGTVRPGIYGLPLNGRNDTATIPTSTAAPWTATHSGTARSARWSIPTTWASSASTATATAPRTRQNITDAATATAVYLCLGPGDLTQPSDPRSAVLRYNQSDAYVQQVVTIADSYCRA